MFSLEIGNSRPLSTRYVSFDWSFNKKIAFISDVHLGVWRSEKIINEVIQNLKKERPDLILVGGDLVDSRRGIPMVRSFVTELSRICQTAVVPGNHDERAGLNKIREDVILGGAHWLLDKRIDLLGKDGSAFTVIGDISHKCASVKNILCAHDPKVFPKALKNNIELTFAGHLHGGQCILFNFKGRSLPGFFFNRWTRDFHKIKNSALIVSKGITEFFSIRFNCPREIIICTI